MGLTVEEKISFAPKQNTNLLISDTRISFCDVGTSVPARATALVVSPFVASQRYIEPSRGPKIRSSPKLAWLHRRIESVDVTPTPHVPEPQLLAPQPTKGTTNAGPMLIWYAAVTVPPPVALELALVPASIVYTLEVVVSVS
jgi:hypothetical protein